MRIKPIEHYEAPKYRGFELKTGKKLAAGAACLAIAATLSGCEAVGKLPPFSNILPTPDIIDETIAGEISVPDPDPTPCPAPTTDIEMLDGMVAQIDAEPAEAEAPDPTPGID